MSFLKLLDSNKVRAENNFLFKYIELTMAQCQPTKPLKEVFPSKAKFTRVVLLYRNMPERQPTDIVK